MRVGIDSLLSSFRRSKKNSNFKQLIELYSKVLEQIKPLQPIGQAAEFKFMSKFEPLPVVWQSLPNAIPEDNLKFWMPNQWPSSSGRAPAQLGPFRRASTNTVFPTWRQSLRAASGQGHLRKMCYHSCETDLFQESKRFYLECFGNLGQWVFLVNFN